jgi:glycerol-3-phosphate dehydrogenase (NAD(P)+)
MTSKILVIGSGAWGTALASLLAKQNSVVNLLTRNQLTLNEINNSHSNDKYLPKIKLPKNIFAINEFNGDWDFVFIALPSNNISEIFLQISKIKFKENCCFVICSKGLIEDSLEFFSNAFERIIGHKNYAILSGPNFAIEVAQDLPTISTIACLDLLIYKKIISIIDNSNFKIKYCDAIECVELCAVMKNIIAIGCGLIEGLNLGNNAKSALVLQGIYEIRQLCLALKIKEDLFSPAGFGDIFLTCSSTKSRNFSLGLLLANNQQIPQDKTFEGLNGLNIILKLSKKLELKLDLCEILFKIANKEMIREKYLDLLIKTILQ